MARRSKPAFGTIHSVPPKTLTKGLRRHLRKVARNNPVEAEAQLTRVGASLASLDKRKR